MAQLTFRAMGCRILTILDAPEPAATVALDALPGWFAGWEQAFSRFQERSELSILNRRAGMGWTPVSPTLWEVLTLAIEAARTSAGLVTPTLAGVLEQAGYDREFSTLQQNGPPAGSPRQHSQTAPIDWRTIKMDARRRMVKLPKGMRLDLGGIAKGWAAGQAVRRLSAYGPALVDAGGDIAVSGLRADATAWPIAVENPHQPGEQLELLLLSKGSVATSGRDYRRWRQGDIEQHHIIDPRSGAPTITDLLAVTVVAPTPEEAEVAAKAALILGSAAGLKWLAARPQLAGLLVTEEGATLRTETLERYCWRAPAYRGGYDER